MPLALGCIRGSGFRFGGLKPKVGTGTPARFITGLCSPGQVRSKKDLIQALEPAWGWRKGRPPPQPLGPHWAQEKWGGEGLVMGAPSLPLDSPPADQMGPLAHKIPCQSRPHPTWDTCLALTCWLSTCNNLQAWLRVDSTEASQPALPQVARDRAPPWEAGVPSPPQAPPGLQTKSRGGER